jgi:hypothetical protein
MTTCLPFEILTAIFEKVDDIQDLRNIRTASRTFCTVAAPIAFRILSVTSTAQSAQNLGRLFDGPEIAAYVKDVAYRDTGADGRYLSPESLKLGAFRVLSLPPQTILRGPPCQSELAPPTNLPVRFLACTSCPSSRPSI